MTPAVPMTPEMPLAALRVGATRGTAREGRDLRHGHRLSGFDAPLTAKIAVRIIVRMEWHTAATEGFSLPSEGERRECRLLLGRLP